MSVNEKMTAIADAIREKTGGTETLNLDEMAVGVGEVYEAGQKSEYDRLWDEFLKVTQNGTMDFVFAGNLWNEATFKPKYSMKPYSAVGMFRRNGCNGDLVELLEGLGVTLDFSECVQMSYLFYEANFTRIGVIDFTATDTTSYAFGYMYNCHTIDLVKLKKENTYVTASFRCPALVNIKIDGEIGQNGFNVQWSTRLSKESITSIINALSDTTSGRTVTFSKTAKEAAFTSEEWAALIATKSNWTISLV